MKRNRKGKIAADSMVVLCSLVLGGYAIMELRDNRWFYLILTALVCIILVAFADICHLILKAHASAGSAEMPEIGCLILLDEDGKPVKSWDLAGRTGVVIGKRGSEKVDIDLSDCEYSCFIDS
jgi:hypothetical protein